MHQRGLAPQNTGEQVAGSVHDLGGAVELDHVCRGIVQRDRPACLRWCAGVASECQIEVNNDRRVGEGRLDSPKPPRRTSASVVRPDANSPGGSSAANRTGHSSTATVTRSAASSASYESSAKTAATGSPT
jgi:hypothetical protein